MANNAEVDIVVNAAGALPDLERQLDRILQTAEDQAPAIDVQASLAAQNTLAVLSTQLDSVLSRIDADDPTIDVDAALDTQEALRNLRQDLDAITRSAATGGTDLIELHAELDFAGSFAELRRSVDDLVETAERTADPIEVEVEVDQDVEGQVRRLTSSFDGLGERARGAAGPIGGLVGTVGRLGATVGAAVPAMAGLVGAVQQLGPAAAVAVSGMVTMRLAAATLKIAMIGVSDAVSAAFDPDVKPEELAEAMDKLAPNARAFVTELASMRKGLQEIQQEVQNRVFDDLDRSLQSLAKATLPELSTAAKGMGDSFNEMARSAAAGALVLDTNGSLGKALTGSTKALRNLEQVPNDVVVALGTIAAAGAPALDRLTQAVAGAADRMSDRLVKAFETGALEQRVNEAAAGVAQLGGSLGSVFAGIGNILSTADEAGGGFLDTIKSITTAFENVTATEGFQDAIRALSETMAVIVDTALPLLSSALQLLGPIFEALGPPIQAVVEVLGAALGPIVAALGPVLLSLSEAAGALVPIFTPFLEVLGQLIATLLPALIPLFDALFVIFQEIAPVAETFATMLGELLTPIIQELGPLLDLLLDPLIELYSAVFPALMDILLALSPSLLELGKALVEVFDAAGPLIKAVLELALVIGRELAPLIQPLVKLLIGLVDGALKVVAGFLTNILVPAIEIVTKLLSGRFSEAWQQVKDITRPAVEAVVGFFRSLRDRTLQLVGQFVLKTVEFINDLAEKFVKRFNKMVDDTIKFFRELPGNILKYLGNLGSLLVNAGADLIRGLINGLKSQLKNLGSVVGDIGSSVVSDVKGFFGISSPSKLMMGLGKDVMRGFIIGMGDMEPALKKQVDGIARIVAPQAPALASNVGYMNQSFTPSVARIDPTIIVNVGNSLFAQYIAGQAKATLLRERRTASQGMRR